MGLLAMGMLKVRRLFTFFVPIILLAAALLFGSILLLRLFFLVVLIIILSYVWTKLSLRKISVHTSDPPEHLQIGDIFKWNVKFINENWLPQLFVQSTCQMGLPEQPKNTIINIPGRGSFEWITDIKCLRRGRYQLGPVQVKVTDPFSLFSKIRTIGGTKETIVYPATIELPFFRSVSFSGYGIETGYRSLSNKGPDAYGVRDFVNGDSLYHIHWPSTARTGKMMVKLFESDRSYSTAKTSWVLLDMNERSHSQSGEQTSEEYAITIAASVVKKHLQEGMKVGMVASDENRLLIKPEMGGDHLWRILKALALMKTSSSFDYSEIISNHNNLFSNSLVIIIATSATPNLPDTVRKLSEKAEMVVVIFLNLTTWNKEKISISSSQKLAQFGAQVYTVNKDDNLSRVIDSNATRTRTITDFEGL
jgi:uncharacterized protein (DUF58 family)